MSLCDLNKAMERVSTLFEESHSDLMSRRRALSKILLQCEDIHYWFRGGLADDADDAAKQRYETIVRGLWTAGGLKGPMNAQNEFIEDSLQKAGRILLRAGACRNLSQKVKMSVEQLAVECAGSEFDPRRIEERLDTILACTREFRRTAPGLVAELDQAGAELTLGRQQPDPHDLDEVRRFWPETFEGLHPNDINQPASQGSNTSTLATQPPARPAAQGSNTATLATQPPARPAAQGGNTSTLATQPPARPAAQGSNASTLATQPPARPAAQGSNTSTLATQPPARPAAQGDNISTFASDQYSQAIWRGLPLSPDESHPTEGRPTPDRPPARPTTEAADQNRRIDNIPAWMKSRPREDLRPVANTVTLWEHEERKEATCASREHREERRRESSEPARTQSDERGSASSASCGHREERVRESNEPARTQADERDPASSASREHREERVREPSEPARTQSDERGSASSASHEHREERVREPGEPAGTQADERDRASHASRGHREERRREPSEPARTQADERDRVSSASREHREERRRESSEPAGSQVDERDRANSASRHGAKTAAAQRRDVEVFRGGCALRPILCGSGRAEPSGDEPLTKRKRVSSASSNPQAEEGAVGRTAPSPIDFGRRTSPRLQPNLAFGRRAAPQAGSTRVTKGSGNSRGKASPG